MKDDGREECCRTAAATMASINSGYTVTPDDTTRPGWFTGMTVNNKNVPYNSNAGTYNTSSGPAKNLNCYRCESEQALIKAINNELESGRSVLLKTLTKTGYEHWVTVTGTIDGKKAESYSDLVGIDPWYNGSNPNNPSTGSGDNACSNSYSGVFQLSKVQTLNESYNIITYVP